MERWKKTALYEVVTKYTSIPDRSYPLLLTLTVRCRYFAVVFCQGNTCIQRISPLVLQSTHRKREKETEREREREPPGLCFVEGSPLSCAIHYITPGVYCHCYIKLMSSTALNLTWFRLIHTGRLFQPGREGGGGGKWERGWILMGRISI